MNRSIIRKRNRYPVIPAESPSRRPAGLTRVQRASLIPGGIVVILALIWDGTPNGALVAAGALAAIAFIGGMLVGR